MGHYLRNSTLARYNKVIDNLRDDIGRIVYIIISSSTSTQCPNCLYDVVNKRSAGMYNGTGPQPFTNGKCPVCSGVGLIGALTKRIPVKATFIPLKNNNIVQGVEGKTEENNIRLRAPYGYKQLFTNCEYTEIDGNKYEVSRAESVGFGDPPVSCQITFRRSD